MTTFVLASASPARLAVLRAAGVDPQVRVSGVDEDALTATRGDVAPAELVLALARAKAHDVAPHVARDQAPDRAPDRARDQDDAVVVGCDSMLHVGGRVVGKPHTVAVARQRWAAMAGASAELLTGHCVLRVRDGQVVGEAAATQTTVVHFADPSAAELEAYLATGEPLEVAGAFTLDGLGGWFVERVEGDPSSVVGIGLPLVRRLLRELGLDVTTCWRS